MYQRYFFLEMVCFALVSFYDPYKNSTWNAGISNARRACSKVGKGGGAAKS